MFSPFRLLPIPLGRMGDLGRGFIPFPTAQGPIPWPTHNPDEPSLAVIAVRRPLWQRLLCWLVWPWRKPRIEVRWI